MDPHIEYHKTLTQVFVDFTVDLKLKTACGIKILILPLLLHLTSTWYPSFTLINCYLEFQKVFRNL